MAYEDNASSFKATVMNFDGSSWQTVGTAGFTAGTAGYATLAFYGSTPYVAYQDAANSDKATVMSFYEPSAPAAGSPNSGSNNSSSSSNNSPKAPDTGYGQPPSADPLVTVLVACATISTGAGLSSLYRRKRAKI